MKTYHLKKVQFLPVSLQEAWDFFSTPKNLSRITPGKIGFEILYISGGDNAYAGQIIRYNLKVMPGVKIHWVTEITQVQELRYFIDEQRFGPYAWWHHQHHFKEVAGGVEMTDEVNYAIPLGILGRLAHFLFVDRELKTIFDYRFKILERLFEKKV